MGNRSPFGVDEYYHCYNRGVDKKLIFETPSDYRRFLKLLYVCNDARPVVLKSFQGRTLDEVFSTKREEILVDIVAYVLMPNHFHLLVREITEGGITTFMRKLGTAYTMYFNLTRERSGVLFQGKFKSIHIDSDRYLKRALLYLYLNPVKLNRSGRGVDETEDDVLIQWVCTYPHSSLYDHFSFRSQVAIISSTARTLLEEQDIASLLKELLVQGRTLDLKEL